MKKEKFYITTTAPYVNALPHIGHTSEFIKADVIARFKRQHLGDENVWLGVGTDEHGLKNFQKARELKKDVREYVDELADEWKRFCKLFEIEYDTFSRSSKEYHHKRAQNFWKRCEEKGDIYKKKYNGWYCVGCEEFKTEKEIIETDEDGKKGKCLIHKKELVWTEEENYFFKLSKYKDKLINYYEANPEVLKPQKARTELINWLKDMEDISISREKENLPWGIEVPGDDTQVMYVWFDALTYYINVLGAGDQGVPEEAFADLSNPKLLNTEGSLEDWWPGVQIFGVDNLRFQAAIWQGMLLSAGYPNTRKLLRNGFILASDGTKMSKSLGNTVSPFEQEKKYGNEAIRFYLVAGIPTYSDSPYKEEDLVNIYNSHLANNFGNLLNRVIHLSNTKKIEINKFNSVEEGFRKKVDDLEKTANNKYEHFELQAAAQVINELASWGNEYITEQAPWAKDKNADEVEKILNNLSYLLANVITLYEPIIPVSAGKAKQMLEKRKKGVLFEKLEKVD